MRLVPHPSDELVEVPTYDQYSATRAARALRAIDVPREQMNAMSLVLVYMMCGLRPAEISELTGLTIDQVNTLSNSALYRETRSAVVEAVKAQQTDVVHDVLVKASHNAANRMTKLVDSDDERIALAASEKVLDRTGHKPADVIERRNVMSRELKIEYVTRTELPAIEDAEYAE